MSTSFDVSKFQCIMMRFYDKLQQKYKPKVKVKIRYLYIHNILPTMDICSTSLLVRTPSWITKNNRLFKQKVPKARKYKTSGLKATFVFLTLTTSCEISFTWLWQFPFRFCKATKVGLLVKALNVCFLIEQSYQIILLTDLVNVCFLLFCKTTICASLFIILKRYLN